GTYFLLSMPGTYYLWTTTAAPGTFSFNDKNRNVANVNITFSAPGTYQIQCQYNNPLSGCSGNSVFTVNVLPVFSFSGDETVCEGSTTTYFANGTATWIVTPVGATVPGGVTAAESITWNIPGTFTITATPAVTGVFCNPNAVKVVQVIAMPVLGSIQGPILVCPGKNLTYSISSNVQGSQFVWTITSGIGTIMSQMGADQDSIILQFNSPGPWTLSVYQQIEISPGIFCQSLPKTLVVNSFSPPVIAGPTTVCVDAVNVYNVSGPTPPGGFQWTVTPPNRGSIIFGQGTGSVTVRWHGTPTVATIAASNCAGTGTLPVTILNPPIVAPITVGGPTQYCFPAMPNNLTLSVTNGFASYQWYLNNAPIGGATSFSYLIPNATFTGQGIYYFSVDVSNGFCTTTQTTYILIGDCSGGGSPPNPVVCSVDFSINPNPVCQNQPATFTAIPSGPGFTYQWNFGDGATSFQSPTEHTYVLPGPYNVSLTATLGSCVVTVVKSITVNPSPVCTITASDTIFCPGSFVTLTTGCPGMSSYQWYFEGNPLPGATGSTYNAGKHGEYWVVVSNSFGCSEKSNAIYIYMHSLPKAKVTGNGSVCGFPGGFTQFPLTAYFNSAYVYNWSSNAVGVTFTPNNSNSSFMTNASLILPVTLPVTYYFVVKATDTLTGCEARDTLCVTFFETPVVNINYYSGCEGLPVNLAPNTVDTVRYHYQWSHGQTTPSITVKAPGSYSLTVIDKSTGCSSTVLAA
ncbi:MAG: PKD domain-containing protein, partial [Bacteroidota bacterium]